MIGRPLKRYASMNFIFTVYIGLYGFAFLLSKINRLGGTLSNTWQQEKERRQDGERLKTRKYTGSR